ncbi:hypothetical protein GCM10009740_12040 [Terrabacter terrae]|uniref:Uncharacterized protein n=1 Tax=Terrabacter terrae TaxID=318434 RepID=A0ABN2TZ36_9MICO
MRSIESVAALPPPGDAHRGDVVLDLDHLSQLFRGRAASRTPLRQRDLPMLGRVLRQQVAESRLTPVVPGLLGELLEAAADDLSPVVAADLLAVSHGRTRRGRGGRGLPGGFR